MQRENDAYQGSIDEYDVPCIVFKIMKITFMLRYGFKYDCGMWIKSVIRQPLTTYILCEVMGRDAGCSKQCHCFWC